MRLFATRREIRSNLKRKAEPCMRRNADTGRYPLRLSSTVDKTKVRNIFADQQDKYFNKNTQTANTDIRRIEVEQWL